MKKQREFLSGNNMLLFEELEQECLTAIRYIEALKVRELSENQKEDILGELSASITHLRIQTEQLDKTFEDIMDV
ncbi:hypothetical protein [Desulfonema magnum]|uniref:Uncharacterized protein n=1 Tax=Desulfonema magnum TaxID=45655 RepID=A0A975GNK4_9BACT|nr:hypothetical protein [Desulfonema magnum]QTA87867.1 Uncharacterized protein dnm_039070 [Desulfonema magnum]